MKYALVGGLLYGNTFGAGLQYHEWTEFISDREFCIRACIGPRSKQLCNHIYDIMGCWWVSKFCFSSGYFPQPLGSYSTSFACRTCLPITVLESTKSVSETLRRLWESTVLLHGSRESARRLHRTRPLLRVAARLCPHRCHSSQAKPRSRS